MARWFVSLALLPIAALAAPAVPQPAQSSATAPRPVDSSAIVGDVRRILNENYVLPEVRPKLDEALARGLESGRYNVSDPAVLVERINADMATVAHDRHLGIEYDPRGYARLTALPADAGANDAAPTNEAIRRAIRGNHGIAELKVLPGNLRYMRYNGFVWAGPKTSEALDNAMRFLRDGDAVILDLRRNGGGSPDAVQYLVSHFLEPNRKIVTFYMRGDPATTLSTLASLPAGRMVGKPLYVLTSGRTGSAAEEFTGHIAGFKIGELIGETTSGAGYRNEFFPVEGGYVISVSVGRAVLASTGKDWEKIGIPPMTKVDPDKALELAQAHALHRLAASATADEKPALAAWARLLEAQVTPAETGIPLAQYAGIYGERVIELDDGSLTLRRNGGPKLAMVAVGAHEFVFVDDPMTRLTFKVAGNSATGFELVRSDGTRVEAQRQP